MFVGSTTSTDGPVGGHSVIVVVHNGATIEKINVGVCGVSTVTTTTMTSCGSVGRSAYAGSRVGSGNGHAADNVIDGIIGNGVVTSVGQSCSLGCGGVLAFVV